MGQTMTNIMIRLKETKDLIKENDTKAIKKIQDITNRLEKLEKKVCSILEEAKAS